MNIFLNEYFGFCFELNFELNHFLARFNEKMNFQNVSPRATHHPPLAHSHQAHEYVGHIGAWWLNWLSLPKDPKRAIFFLFDRGPKEPRLA